MKDVTICLLTHNRQEQLRITLDNLYEQFGSAICVMVLNNGSTDNTDALLKEFSSGHSNIQMFNSFTNLGVSKGRSFLWEKVQTPYILSMDDDIVLSSEALRSMVSSLIFNGSTGVVSPNIKDSKSGKLANTHFLSKLPTFYEACFLIRKDVIESIGAFDSRLMFAGEGMDYALRLRKAGFQVFRDTCATVVHYDRERTNEDWYTRRLQWLWCFCFVYWKNLTPASALYWTLRNMMAHARTGFSLFGVGFVAKLPRQALAGAIAGVKARNSGV
jgi:GT2 family glycosyltransferase